jgi:hypothetical protein
MHVEKWILHLEHDIDKALVPHHPNTIAFKGWLCNMGKQDQGYFLHIL